MLSMSNEEYAAMFEEQLARTDKMLREKGMPSLESLVCDTVRGLCQVAIAEQLLSVPNAVSMLITNRYLHYSAETMMHFLTILAHLYRIDGGAQQVTINAQQIYSEEEAKALKCVETVAAAVKEEQITTTDKETDPCKLN